jgi:flagellar FliL protein
MASDTPDLEDESKPKSKKPLVIGLVLSLALGAGGFFAMSSGLISIGTNSNEKQSEVDTRKNKVAFVEMAPMTISLGSNSPNKHLIFRAHLEVEPKYADEVTSLLPRVTDVLNGYLRAVRTSDLEQPTSLIRLRAQMLRRVQIVVGQGKVRDLLVMEFVLN